MILAGVLVAGAAGACVGSFAVTAALRAARGEPWAFGRSHCDGCDRTLGFAETWPIASYLLRRGRCASCGARIDPLHPIGEVVGAVVGGAAFAVLPPVSALAVSAVGLLLLTAAAFDWRTQRLPDVLTLSVGGLGAALAWQHGATALWTGLAAAAVAFVLLEAVRRGYTRLRGRGGLGFGDVKLIAALALWLGLATPWAVVAASLLGLLMILAVRPADGRLAFGPMIAAAGFAVGLMQEVRPWPLG